MSEQGKKYKQAVEKAPKEQVPVSEALKKIKELAYAKFDESVDINVNLGIDPSKGEQVVKGSVILPHSKGNKIRVVVFAKGDHVDEALKAGADYVGAEDLVEKISAGWLDFEFAIATPDLMGLVGKVAKILGPRGLLPNKKTGTVTFDIASTIAEFKKGRVFFRNDKSGIVHFSFGKVSFDVEKLRENLATFFKALIAAKPPTSKGKYLKKVTLSSTMGVGVMVNPDEFLRM